MSDWGNNHLSPLRPADLYNEVGWGFFAASLDPRALHAFNTRIMKKITYLCATSVILGLGVLGCGDSQGKVTKVQPKPPVAEADKVKGPDDAFNDNRKLQSTSEAPPSAPKKKKKAD